MKPLRLLVAVPDPAGFNFTNQLEIVYLSATPCPQPTCGCDRAWFGATTKRGATLAQVRPAEEVIEANPDLNVDMTSELFDRTTQMIYDLPIGTNLRARFLFKQADTRQLTALFLTDPESLVAEVLVSNKGFWYIYRDLSP